jgi:hypothetical protein
MPRMLVFCLLWLLCGVGTFGAVQVAEETIFTRMCSASAGVALSPDIFVVADDEINRLRTYSRAKPGIPIHELDLSAFLQVGKGNPEIDLEGAAQIGDVVYWITSHGRNRDGEIRPSRQRFFATKVSGERLELTGKPYANLLNDLIAEESFRDFGLREAAEKAPNKKGGLNVEGLCARPDGTLLIAFRNPVPKKKALLIPLLNPAELVQGGNARAKFGPAIHLPMNDNGVRDMVQRDGQYYIIAGARDGGHATQLYRWDGAGAPLLLHRWEAKTFNPEAILIVPGKVNEFLILSDDGSLKTAGQECKDLPETSRRFRTVVLRVPQP